MKRILRSFAAAAILSAAVFLPSLPQSDDDKAVQAAALANTDCATPALAASLARRATSMSVARTLPDGRNVIRFDLAASVTSIGHAIDSMPHATVAGYDWYVRANLYVQWLPSEPCSGQDGYGFGFDQYCYRSPVGTESPRTNVTCNWDMRGSLQFDYSAHDWDAAWGWREYHVSGSGSCSDVGPFHFFPDSSTAELRTVVHGRVRFVSPNYLQANYRKMGSQHVEIGSGAVGQHSPGVWVETGTPPAGTDAPC